LRIIWLSELLQKYSTAEGTKYRYMPSGFASQTKNIVETLIDKKYDISVVDWIATEPAIQMTTRVNRAKYKVFGGYPYGFPKTDFGQRILPNVLDSIRPSLLITLADTWMIAYIKNIKHPKWIHYCPVDGGPIPPEVSSVLKSVDQVVAMSKYGQNELNKVGIDSIYIPHGVNTQIFYPIPTKQKEEFKKSIGYEDKFIWLFVGRNQPRKNIHDLMRAYKKFNDLYPNKSILYCHCDPFDRAGSNLEDFARMLGIQKNFIWTEDFLSINDRKLNYIYNIADVHISATIGEGFGVTTLESMACGIPNIIGNHTTSPELVKGRGLLVDIDRVVTGRSLVDQYFIDIDDMVRKMIILYEDEQLRKQFSKKCREFSLKFDWQNIIPRWESLLLTTKIPRQITSRTKPIKPKSPIAMVCSTLGKKCGVAEYTKHLVDELKKYRKVILVKEYDEAIVPKLLEQGVEICHIQFEYGMYNRFDQFNDFVIKLKESGIKIIITMHSWNDFAANFNQVIINVDSLIAHNNGLKERLVEYGANPEKVFVIPHGTLPLKITEDVKKTWDIFKKNKLSDKKIIATFGFVEPYKGFLELLVAFRELRKKYKDLKLITCCHNKGHSVAKNYERQLDLFIKQNKLQKHVIKINKNNEFFDDQTLANILHAADVVVLSHIEQFTYSASGALLTGLTSLSPVVCTDITFFDDIEDINKLSTGCVYKSKTNTTLGLVTAIDTVLSDKKLQKQLVKNAKIKLEKDCWKNIATKHIEVYKKF